MKLITHCITLAFLIGNVTAFTPNHTFSAKKPQKARYQNNQLNGNRDKNNDGKENSFQPNRPISLPSLENPPDDPLFNICKSSTGENEFIPNKPIELDSLKENTDRSILGIEPRPSDEEGAVPLLMETGLGVFTSSIILGGSIYCILAVFLDNGDGVDPLMSLSF